MSALPNCKFCNFYRIPGHADAYITDIETYKRKIEETFRWGVISCSCREDTIRSWDWPSILRYSASLKSLYPTLKLHTLGPPEIAHISKLEKMSHHDVLVELKKREWTPCPAPGQRSW